MFLLLFFAAALASSVRGMEPPGVDCREMTDLEVLCEHKAQCEVVLPDLGDLCRSFKRERYGIDEYVKVIDSRRSDMYIITTIGEGTFDDASPPIIIQGPRNITVSPGSQYLFECKAEGAPTPELTITRLEEASLERLKLKDDGDPKISVSSAHVIRRNERVQFADEGWYRCVAANTRGVVFADAYLRVFDLCRDITCTGGKICVPDNYAGTAECRCPECADEEYEPLCATDCITYFNPCQLENANCRRASNYTIFMNQFCPQFDAPAFTTLPPRVMDAVEDKSFTLTCQAAPAGEMPGPPPIISWYMALEESPSEDPTAEGEGATVAGMPDFTKKLGEGETIRLRTKDDVRVVCVAHQCKYGQSIPIDIASPTVSVRTRPPEFNSWPGPSCQVFGDPTIITFDGLGYDFSGQCEYILAADCSDYSWFVYGKFEACSSHRRGSCLSAVTFYLNRDILFQMKRGRVLNNNGARVDYRRDGIAEIITGEDGTQVWVRLDEDWLDVTWKDPNNHLFSLRYDGLLSVQVLIPDSFAGEACGLCGNYNGDATDEWWPRSGKAPIKDVNEFGDSWKVDRYEKCAATKPWDWEREFADRRPGGERVCEEMFATEQLADCAEGWREYETSINPEPYKAACIADYMRSDFLEGMGVSMTMPCMAAFNYAERCGNRGNVVHLWAEQTGCGTEDEMIDYSKFVDVLGECLK